MISIDDIEGELEVTVQRGPARQEGESDEEYLARISATETQAGRPFTVVTNQEE